jgi:acetyl-CoA C-acetyltransferase
MGKKSEVYILGGYQTDFARNWRKEGVGFADGIKEASLGALTDAEVEPREIEVAHLGNFAGELYCHQGHLGAFILEASPEFDGLPTARHEAACASGSIAILAAMADLEAERYRTALVVGLEQMKTVSPAEGGDFLGTAAWYEREAKGIEYPFPKLFGRLGDEYEARYGLNDEHLDAISAINYANAKRNPKAQTRGWAPIAPENNRPIGGRIKVTDCSQITDGAVGLVLGHHTAPILFDEKLNRSRGGRYVLPHVRRTIEDALSRAAIAGVRGIDGIETHDCFTTSEYMAIDHFGLTEPGENWKAIEEGVIAFGGACPINAGGGLIGAGHPVGATGVRQTLDAALHVAGRAGDYQIEGARNVATLNIGGSGTTSVSFVVGVG